MATYQKALSREFVHRDDRPPLTHDQLDLQFTELTDSDREYLRGRGWGHLTTTEDDMTNTDRVAQNFDDDEPTCTCSINSAGGIHYYDPDCLVHFPPERNVDPRAEIIAQHADYVSGGVRHCSCGLWSDDSPDAQGTRIPFAHHIMGRLALHDYVITLATT